MEAKFFVYLFLLLALIGGGVGIYHSTEIDEANKELISTTNQIGSLENHIKNQALMLELRKEVAALLTAKSILNKEQSEIRKEVGSYRDGELSARKLFDQAVAGIRKDSVGLVLQDAILPSGLRLHNARIQSIEGDTTTIIHAEGISRLTPDMLPVELKERFRFGMPLGSSPAGQASTAVASATSPLSTGAPKEDQASTLSRQLAVYQKELPYLESELQKAEGSSNAASPSQKFYIKNRIDSLNQQIKDLKEKMQSAESEIKKLASDS